MLLRRFEAYGFKSFAEKVEVEFGTGVTAIVGPNGSGKSNISDAIRWVLGEQNVRNLRGAKTEDIIFAGSSERRPLNVAEVSLVFDNSDNRIPLDFSEVIITRRVYRSGESEYMINKTACRLKDIHDLLGDIGLGRESMAVISQNKVDEVLNCRPEDRRLLFEDAAGITKYKHRKRDALRKLEDTESNITRVADIMTELGSQLTPLKESANRTEQYNMYHTELKACQVSLLLHKHDRANAMLTDIRLEKENLNNSFLQESTRLATCEAESEGLTHLVADYDEKLSQREQEIQINAGELERTEQRIAVLNERTAQKQAAGQRIEQEIVQFVDKLQEASASEEALLSDLQNKRQLVQNAASEVDGVDEQLEAILRLIREKEQEIAAANDTAFQNLQEITSQRNASVNLERDLNRYRSRRQHLLHEAEEYSAKRLAAQARQQQLNEEHSSLAETLAALAAGAEEFRSTRGNLNIQVTAAQTDLRHIASKVTQCQSRMTVLENMQRDLEGLNRGSKSILTSKEPWRKGICGAVAQLVQVPPQYVTAVEIALGGALGDIITEDEGTVRLAIEHLKRYNGGRVTFLPITVVKPRTPRDTELRISKAPGSHGFASGLVDCDVRYRGIVDHLLGRVIVAENLNAALAIAKQSGFSVKIVTLDGELINPGGAITGGSLARRESSYLGRTGEIRNLEEQHKSLVRQQEDIEVTLSKLKSQSEDLTRKEQALLANRQELDVRQAQLIAYCDQIKVEVSRLDSAVETVHTESQECLREEIEIEQQIVQTKETIAALEKRDFSRKEETVAARTQLQLMQEQKDHMASESTNKKVALSALKQEIVSVELLLRRQSTERQEIANRISDLQREKREIDCEIAEAKQELDRLGEHKNILGAKKQELETDRLSVLGKKAEKLAVLQKIEKESKDIRKHTQMLESRLHELQLMLSRYEYDIANAIDQLQCQYMLTLETAKELCRPDEPQSLMNRVKILEQEIAMLGPVNPAAIEEYSRVSERHSFLERQYHDLVNAKEQLASIISDIDATMAKQFMSAFESINAHFREIFPRLFGGGKAQIELSEPTDVLHSGIEIFVQPPGKKQQNLALLSGGERALTVIALLFSFLAYRPAPFSVVDEIDAALDEANVARFSEFLREFSQNTQFIVVTHRKGTMEVADVMHGVTMEDSGVSRIVSVRFMDKAG